MIRTLVVDDTILYRKILTEALAQVPEVRIVGTAPNGRIALSKIFSLQPNIVTLDIEMPEMNGIEVLEALRDKKLDTCVIVVSSLTRRGGELTMRALELGAFDFITKPEGGKNGAIEFARTLAAIVNAAAKQLEIKRLLKGIGSSSGGGAKRLDAANTDESSHPKENPNALPPIRPRTTPQRPNGEKTEIVAIGASTGGPQALLTMLPRLPAKPTAAILIVQHMPPLFTANLANSLSARCSFPVTEAEDGETLQAGVAYIAPGGRQMKVALAPDAATKIIRITDDPPENHCRPSADYLFRSVAHLFYGRAAGVIMTGMGSDGVEGLRALKRAGATIFAQDEASCVVYGMPKAAVDAGVVDEIVPLEKMAAAISAVLR